MTQLLCSKKRTREKKMLKDKFQIKQKPLNMITLGQPKSDNNNRIIAITDYFYLVIFSKKNVEMLSN